MPVRFQVDPDFYDHPKTIGMSDAAFSLWVRAGSFSAAKTTDGLIEDDVLVHTLRSSTDTADELVRRRLWRRVKGGYKFHQWENRNLTKKRVEEDREADRERKRLKRLAELAAAGQNKKPQATPQNVRPESERNPEGIPPDSEGIPDRSVSVSVSVSESVSGSGRGTEAGHPPPGEPPPRCPDHIDNPTDDPCGGCGRARKVHEAWQEANEQHQLRQDQLRRSQTAKQRAEASRVAIQRCDRCNHLGQLGNGLACNHEPEALHAAELAAAARANIRPAPVVRQRADSVALARQRDPESPLDAALAEVIPIKPDPPPREPA